MKLNSVKSRFLGSYAFLIFLFVAQLPVFYLLIGSMSQKYPQVDAAGQLRKRAIEIQGVLIRHIHEGDEALEAVFQRQKGEYSRIIEEMRNGSGSLPAVTEPETLGKLDKVAAAWEAMRASLDEAMEAGDKLSEITAEIEKTTPETVDEMNGLVKGFLALNDKSYAKNIDLAGTLRMRTVKLSYLMERYTRSNSELGAVAAEINATAREFDEILKGLSRGSAALGLRAATGAALKEKLAAAEVRWAARKELIAQGIRNKDVFNARIGEMTNKHTPALLAATDELTDAIAAKARGSANTGLITMALAVLVSVCTSVLFIWSTNKHILTPLVKVKETLNGLTAGDLSRRADISVKFMGKEIKDEITDLGSSVDEMAGRMSRMIGSIAESSNQLASASEELSATTTQMSGGASRQSGQATQVATAMEEMNAAVVEVAKNAQKVSESARSAREIAARGGDVVKQATDAMKEVSEATSVAADTIKRLGSRSEEIGTIVSVINDIADQTNLLALNAAIEAARAGEQGRGFAVVADEVRKLAERTTGATKEITGMIQSIQDETGKAVTAMADGTVKVENGVNLANEAGEALGQIVLGVQNVSDMIGQIVLSTEQQSTTSDEISKNMESIADVARANVAAIADVASTTAEMARLASGLQELVSGFANQSSIGAKGGARTAEVIDIAQRAAGRADERRPVGRLAAVNS